MNSDFPLTLYYDGDCQMCRAEMRNLELRDVYGQLRFVTSPSRMRSTIRPAPTAPR